MPFISDPRKHSSYCAKFQEGANQQNQSEMISKKAEMKEWMSREILKLMNDQSRIR